MATWKTIIVKIRKETVDISDIQHDEGEPWKFNTYSGGWKVIWKKGSYTETSLPKK